MKINNKQFYSSLRSRYQSAKVYLFDAEYTATDRSVIDKAYSQFIWQMRLVGLTMWLANKLDCDKWAWLFKAYVTVRNALSKRSNALPVGIICYHVGADKSRPHCINAYAHTDGEEFSIVELEPQPKSGTKELTEEERKTVWLAVF